MSSGVSRTPSGPGWSKLQAHCWATTRTISCAGGSSCFTWYQTRTAPTMMKMSQTSTSRCGIEIQRFSVLSSPVMYSAGTPSRLRKRTISQTKRPSVSTNQKPTRTKTSVKMASMSDAKVEAAGTSLSIMVLPRASEDEDEDDGDEGPHPRHGDEEGPHRELVRGVRLRHGRPGL